MRYNFSWCYAYRLQKEDAGFSLMVAEISLLNFKPYSHYHNIIDLFDITPPRLVFLL